uniref:RHH_1 domain-containing protein n=1 Tax=Heterorhabditis bacteriophora TaxID=37862 RepID=A0A1I7X3E2_HETBA
MRRSKWDRRGSTPRPPHPTPRRLPQDHDSTCRVLFWMAIVAEHSIERVWHYVYFQDSSQHRQDLLRVIKEARLEGLSRMQVHDRIDDFLKTHLDATEILEIEQLKREGSTFNAGITKR